METPESTQPTVLSAYQHCPSCHQHFSGDARFCPFDGEPLVAAAGDHAESDPLLGSVIDGRYEVEAVLGEGGMGTVYSARHRALDKYFALKVMRADLARQGDLAARFIQEARAAASIGHPNIVQITDFGELGTQAPYFVMELLDGMSLAKMIRAGGPLPARLAVQILQQVASALAAAHAAGVIHRDLKPDNVHVARGNVVKILDFGVAKMAGVGRLTRTGMVFGTPHYMSPEQASGGEVDHRADIYALGIIMYEMFTGRVPFDADSYMGVLTKHMYMAPEPPSRVHESARELGALEDVIMRCLAKRPDARYPSMEALVRDVESIVRFRGDELEITRPALSAPGEPVQRGVPAPGEVSTPAQVGIGVRQAEPPPYRRALAVTLAVGCAVLAAAVVTIVGNRGQEPSSWAAPPAVLVAGATPPIATAVPPLASAPSPAPLAEPTPLPAPDPLEAPSPLPSGASPPAVASFAGVASAPSARPPATRPRPSSERPLPRPTPRPGGFASDPRHGPGVNDIVNPWAK